MDDARLSVTGLRAGYGPQPVLCGIDLQARAGEVTVLLGGNGAGKTTLLRAVCGLLPGSGTIALDGRRLDGLASAAIARLGVAHVPQWRGTFLRFSVDENLRLGAISRRDRRQVRADLAAQYARFPVLAERRRQPAATLSGGEQQMLAIARALMLRPRLLLLDEPSFGLAPALAARLFDDLRGLVREQRLGLLLVEQNVALALRAADRVWLLRHGRVACHGTPQSLRDDPRLLGAYLGD